MFFAKHRAIYASVLACFVLCAYTERFMRVCARSLCVHRAIYASVCTLRSSVGHKHTSRSSLRLGDLCQTKLKQSVPALFSVPVLASSWQSQYPHRQDPQLPRSMTILPVQGPRSSKPMCPQVTHCYIISERSSLPSSRLDCTFPWQLA